MMCCSDLKPSVVHRCIGDRRPRLPALREAHRPIFFQATIAAPGCAVFTVGQEYRTPAYRSIRVAMCLLLGASVFMSIAHGVFGIGWEILIQRQGLSYFVGLGLLKCTGAAIYAVRIPERWYPKTFEILGSSHQIMHVLVMFGALCYSIGLVRAFDY